MKCRVCQGLIEQVLSLGRQWIATYFVVPGEEVPTLSKFPLSLFQCGSCGLVQLGYNVDRRILFDRYWYRSGISETMRNALQEIADEGTALLELKPGDRVVDIGANDGTLLRSFKTPELNRIGFEPSQLAKGWGLMHGLVINDYFHRREEWDGTAKLVTAVAVLYSVDKIVELVQNVEKLLHPEGLFCVQLSYLPLMVKQVAFDNILHEHLFYFSLASLEVLLACANLHPVRASLNDVNGGSIRVWAARGGSHWKDDGSVARIRAREPVAYDWQRFSFWVEDRIEYVQDLLLECQVQGKTVDLLGASTKGNVFLQTAGIHHGLVRQAWERDQRKHGARTLGTGIPIVGEEEIACEDPEMKLVMPWHFLPEIVEREGRYLARGGELVVALPLPLRINRETKDSALVRFKEALGLENLRPELART